MSGEASETRDFSARWVFELASTVRSTVETMQLPEWPGEIARGVVAEAIEQIATYIAEGISPGVSAWGKQWREGVAYYPKLLLDAAHSLMGGSTIDMPLRWYLRGMVSADPHERRGALMQFARDLTSACEPRAHLVGIEHSVQWANMVQPLVMMASQMAQRQARVAATAASDVQAGGAL